MKQAEFFSEAEQAKYQELRKKLQAKRTDPTMLAMLEYLRMRHRARANDLVGVPRDHFELIQGGAREIELIIAEITALSKPEKEKS